MNRGWPKKLLPPLRLCRYTMDNLKLEPPPCKGSGDTNCSILSMVQDNTPGDDSGDANVSKVLNEKPSDGLCKQESDLLKQEPGLLKKEPGLLKVEEPGMCKKEPGLLKKEPGLLEKEPGLLKKVPGAGAALPDGADVERLDDKNRVQSTEDKVAGSQQARRLGLHPSPGWVHIWLSWLGAYSDMAGLSNRVRVRVGLGLGLGLNRVYRVRVRA